jgi:hypothetical protein
LQRWIDANQDLQSYYRQLQQLDLHLRHDSQPWIDATPESLDRVHTGWKPRPRLVAADRSTANSDWLKSAGIAVAACLAVTVGIALHRQDASPVPIEIARAPHPAAGVEPPLSDWFDASRNVGGRAWNSLASKARSVQAAMPGQTQDPSLAEPIDRACQFFAQRLPDACLRLLGLGR